MNNAETLEFERISKFIVHAELYRSRANLHVSDAYKPWNEITSADISVMPAGEVCLILSAPKIASAATIVYIKILTSDGVKNLRYYFGKDAEQKSDVLCKLDLRRML